MPNPRKELHTKLYKHLMSRTVVNPETGCFVWTGYTLPSGYAQIWRPMVDGKRSRDYVHRLAWETFAGPIPEGYEIDHVAERGCISKACWNIAHLEPVLPIVNKQRRDANGVKNQYGVFTDITPAAKAERRRIRDQNRKDAQ